MIGVRILRLAATAALSAALAGCGVVSDAPLFNPEAAPQHRLGEGLWAMSGPGCEVAPNVAGDLPDCAAPVTVAGGKMSWDVRAYLAHTMGVAAQSLAPSMLPKTTAFVQVDGDPQILELLNQSPDDAGLAQQPSYLAMKVLQADPAGRIVRGIIWPVSCPPPGRDLPPGMRRDGVRCVATTPAAIQSQSKAPPPPFQSFFLTWISPKID